MKKYRCINDNNADWWTKGKVYEANNNGQITDEVGQIRTWHTKTSLQEGIKSTGGDTQFELVTEDKRGDGQATDYYELPEDATQLGDLIRHKHMEHGIGEAFCALYRLNDNGEKLRNLKKALYYITEEIKHEKK